MKLVTFKVRMRQRFEFPVDMLRYDYRRIELVRSWGIASDLATSLEKLRAP